MNKVYSTMLAFAFFALGTFHTVRGLTVTRDAWQTLLGALFLLGLILIGYEKSRDLDNKTGDNTG